MTDPNEVLCPLCDHRFGEHLHHGCVGYGRDGDGREASCACPAYSPAAETLALFGRVIDVVANIVVAGFVAYLVYHLWRWSRVGFTILGLDR